ncbi:MAG: prolipoprotein diacylglyceryl transferase [Chloroflexota bacterium]|jgi:phosphatidylglycerol---prolipoprotein diacylglyceryl transferase
MYPILHRYGPFFLYSYTVVMIVGVLLVVGLTWWRIRLDQSKGPYATPALQSTWFDGILVLLLAGLVGGRIGFVIGAWNYFQDHPHEAWQIWQGGLSYHGALLAGGVAFGLWSFWKSSVFHLPYAVFRNYSLGLYAPGFALLVMFGWGACWLDGCAYGQETTLGWLAADLPDAYGVYGVRYQTQMGGIFTGLVALLLPWGLAHWLRVGNPVWLFGVTLLLVSLGHLLVGLGRGDELPLLWGWPVGLWLDGMLAFTALLLVWRGVYDSQRPFLTLFFAFFAGSP